MITTKHAIFALLITGFILIIAPLASFADPAHVGSDAQTAPGPTPTYAVFFPFVAQWYFAPPPPLEVIATGWLRSNPEFNPCLWGSHFLEDDDQTIVAWLRSDVITDWDLYVDRYVRVRGPTDTPIGGCPPRIIVTHIEVLIELTPTPQPTPTPTATPRPPE
jgi:hypothetical protein